MTLTPYWFLPQQMANDLSEHNSYAQHSFTMTICYTFWSDFLVSYILPRLKDTSVLSEAHHSKQELICLAILLHMCSYIHSLYSLWEKQIYCMNDKHVRQDVQVKTIYCRNDKLVRRDVQVKTIYCMNDKLVRQDVQVKTIYCRNYKRVLFN